MIFVFFSPQNYVISLIEHVYKDVGFIDDDNGDPLAAYKRIDIIAFACRLGYSDCVQQSLKQFKDWMNSENPDKYNE